MPHVRKASRILSPLNLPPIQSLPNELLSSIFAYATHQHHDHYYAILIPLTISHVCPRWREISLSTGALWTQIILTFPTSEGQLVRTAEWLDRSKTAPLDLLLDVRDPEWKVDSNESTHLFTDLDMQRTLRFLLPHVGRWRKCELLADTWVPIHTFLSETSKVTPVPMLESVSLSRCNAFFADRDVTFQPHELAEAFPLFGGHANHLRAVELAGVHVDWPSLRGLTALELRYHASDVMPTLKRFTRMLLSCPALQRLSIIGWGPRFPGSDSDSDTPAPPIRSASKAPSSSGSESEGQQNPASWRRSIQLRHLQRFSFGFIDPDYAIQLLSLFSFPSLESLSIEDVTRILNPLGVEDATPILEWLAPSVHSTTTTTGNRAVPGISPSPFPSGVMSSSSTATTLTGPTHQTFIAFPLTQIENLELHGIRATQSAFREFVGQLTGLRQLKLSDMDTFVNNDDANDILEVLGPSSLIATHSSRFLCPGLRVLECRGVDIERLADVVEARKEARAELGLEKVVLEADDLTAIDAPLRKRLKTIGVSFGELSRGPRTGLY